MIAGEHLGTLTKYRMPMHQRETESRARLFSKNSGLLPAHCLMLETEIQANY
jgi:hypothetical protein